MNLGEKLSLISEEKRKEEKGKRDMAAQHLVREYSSELEKAARNGKRFLTVFLDKPPAPYEEETFADHRTRVEGIEVELHITPPVLGLHRGECRATFYW